MSTRIAAMLSDALALMPRTEIRRAPEDDRSRDRPAAPRTSFTFFAMQKEIALRKLAAGGAAPDDFRENFPHSHENRTGFDRFEPVDAATRMNRRLEQSLVRIQIADAGDDILRHEQRLDRAAFLLEQRPERSQI